MALLFFVLSTSDVYIIKIPIYMYTNAKRNMYIIVYVVKQYAPELLTLLEKE